jgi:hypothetical protein
MWTVNVVVNNLETSIETAEKLDDFLHDRDYCLTVIKSLTDGTAEIEPDSDAYEWIDFIGTFPEAVDILISDPNTNGMIGFADFAGDNYGKIWGYSFGNGQMEKLTGRIEWS